MRILSRRFDELSEQLKPVEMSKKLIRTQYSDYYESVDSELLLNWCVKARSLIANVCGKDSEYYASFVKAEKIQSYETNVDNFKRVKAVFLAAMEDFNGGYINTIRNFVQAELAEDEIDQARELLASGYTAAAAVVAGVVLETTLRTLCSRHNLVPASMDRMNAELAKSGQYNTLVQKRITTLAAVRNSAAHGKTEEYGANDVQTLILDVERFVSDMFS